MNLEMLGTNTSPSEVTNIIHLGFWLLVDGAEHFVPFADYPAFRVATVPQIYNMHRLSPTQFHWPELDIDIELEALHDPEKFSLVYQEHP